MTYENHQHFSGVKSTKPSPVRIFTNLPPPGLQLPSSEGYRYCEQCNRYVARNNTHCDKCGSCTSKVSSDVVASFANEPYVFESWDLVMSNAIDLLLAGW